MDKQEIIDLYLEADEEVKEQIEELLKVYIADKDCNLPL